MIKTDRQLANMRTLARRLATAVAAHDPDQRPVGVDEGMHRLTLAANQGMLERVQGEIADYEALKAGDGAGIVVTRLADIPKALIQTRILRGLTQKALAGRLHVAEQQVQRWEQQDYENAGFTRLMDIAEALEFDLTSVKDAAEVVTLPAPPAGSRHYAHAAGMPAWPRWELEAGADPGRLLRILQKANTFNHTSAVQYALVAGDRHKALKEALKGGRPAADILERYVALITFLNDAFETATAHNVRFLSACFKNRDATPPRICLKGNLIDAHTDWIVPLFRSSKVDYDSRVQIAGNTGFAHVARHGGYYLENDLPAAALRGEYVNPRLDTVRIARDFGASPEAAPALSQAWPAYWTSIASEQPAGSCYRSTLIMPLKLWDSEVSPQFEEVLSSREIKTKIFGYLCIDHREAGYFWREVDVNMSKIFADALCALVLLRLNFTVHSKTVSTVRKMPQVAGWEAMGLSRPAHPRAPSVIELDGRPVAEFRTPANTLEPVDEPLLHYLAAE